MADIVSHNFRISLGLELEASIRREGYVGLISSTTVSYKNTFLGLLFLAKLHCLVWTVYVDVSSYQIRQTSNFPIIPNWLHLKLDVSLKNDKLNLKVVIQNVLALVTSPALSEIYPYDWNKSRQPGNFGNIAAFLYFILPLSTDNYPFLFDNWLSSLFICLDDQWVLIIRISSKSTLFKDLLIQNVTCLFTAASLFGVWV